MIIFSQDQWVHTLDSGDHETWSTLIQVKVCCLMNEKIYIQHRQFWKHFLCTVMILGEFKCRAIRVYTLLDRLLIVCSLSCEFWHDDVIKWTYFPPYWPFVRGNQRWPVNSPHKGQWREALMFSLICAWTNGWVNNRDADDLRRHCHVTVMVRYL